MASSFISERSAELILVPRLIEELREFYPSITPVFYWVSREGSKMSHDSFQHRKVRILVLYARRPKIEFVGSGEIQIKINQLLFNRAAKYKQVGMPVIAGCPLADDLEKMQFGIECVWLNIDPEGIEENILFNLAGERLNNTKTCSLQIGEIVNIIDATPIITWQQAIQKISEVKRQTRYGAADNVFHFGVYGDMYKPIYLIIHV